MPPKKALAKGETQTKTITRTITIVETETVSTTGNAAKPMAAPQKRKAKDDAAPSKKTKTVKDSTPAKKTTTTAKKVTAKKAPAEKALAKKPLAKKAPVKKSPVKNDVTNKSPGKTTTATKDSVSKTSTAKAVAPKTCTANPSTAKNAATNAAPSSASAAQSQAQKPRTKTTARMNIESQIILGIIPRTQDRDVKPLVKKDPLVKQEFGSFGHAAAAQDYCDDQMEWQGDDDVKEDDELKDEDDELKYEDDNDSYVAGGYEVAYTHSGVYKIDCPQVALGWPDYVPERGQRIRFLYIPSEGVCWGSYDLGMFSGYFRSTAPPELRDNDQGLYFRFEWRGIDAGEGEMTYGKNCTGWIRKSGNCEIKGAFRDLHEPLTEFAGRRFAQPNIAAGTKEEYQREFYAINDGTYEEARRNRWR